MKTSISKFAIFTLLSFVPAFGTDWHATVGAQDENKGRQVVAFLPNELWIHAGDSIQWNVKADEIHTVSFLTAGQVRLPFDVGCPGFSFGAAIFDGSTCISTPPMVSGQSFTVTFPVPGNFKLVCLVHPDMTGVVHVLDSTKPLPHTQDFYDQQAASQALALLSSADSQDDEAGTSVSHSLDHHVTMGGGQITANAGGTSAHTIMRFAGHTMIIHAGQAVESNSDDPEDPHTITFGAEPAGDPFPPSTNVTLDVDGARHAVINSVSDSVHSG